MGNVEISKTQDYDNIPLVLDFESVPSAHYSISAECGVFSVVYCVLGLHSLPQDKRKLGSALLFIVLRRDGAFADSNTTQNQDETRCFLSVNHRNGSADAIFLREESFRDSSNPKAWLFIRLRELYVSNQERRVRYL